MQKYSGAIIGVLRVLYVHKNMDLRPQTRPQRGNTFWSAIADLKVGGTGWVDEMSASNFFFWSCPENRRDWGMSERDTRNGATVARVYRCRVIS